MKIFSLIIVGLLLFVIAPIHAVEIESAEGYNEMVTEEPVGLNPGPDGEVVIEPGIDEEPVELSPGFDGEPVEIIGDDGSELQAPEMESMEVIPEDVEIDENGDEEDATPINIPDYE